MRFFRRKKKKIPKDRFIKVEVRNFVIKRDKNRCVYCGKKKRKRSLFRKAVIMEFGHVIPHSHGGDRCQDNIQLECKPCNRNKGAKIKKTKRQLTTIKRKGAKGCKKHKG